MTILVKNGILVNEGVCRKADILIEDDCIKSIVDGVGDYGSVDKVIDASDCYVLPGVIDSHVHFREPGLTHKADMETESRAAAYGGVTSVFDMPNTVPQTTTPDALEHKRDIARSKMCVNYTFFPGATNDNIAELSAMDRSAIPGIKLFMGSSTGNMLVDKEQALDAVFAMAHDAGLPVMAHCEDTQVIERNMDFYRRTMGDDVSDFRLHPMIRSEEACVKSSALALKLARRHGTRLHIAHISTAKELDLITPDDKNITLEATVAHLLYCDEDYERLGARIKCNPAIKTSDDRTALRAALAGSGIYTIGTDHAPHTLTEKQGGVMKAVSGMPMVQFSLVAMLTLMDEECLTMERIVELMCHNPARLFSVSRRGFLRQGYKADMAIVRREPWTVTKDCIQSKCGWSPLEGMRMQWQVRQTVCNGCVVYDNGVFDSTCRGEALTFER